MENSDFNKRAENMLSQLFTVGSDAATKVQAVTSKLDAQSGALEGLAQQVSGVDEAQQAVLLGVNAGLEALAQVHAASEGLQAGLLASIAQQGALEDGQRALASELSTLHEDERRHASMTLEAWKVRAVLPTSIQKLCVIHRHAASSNDIIFSI